MGNTNNKKPSLPLLRLPDLVLIEVLQNMEFIDQISLSLCSNVTKRLIIRQNHQANHFQVDISNFISLQTFLPNTNLRFKFFYRGRLPDHKTYKTDPMDVPFPESVHVNYSSEGRSGKYEWSKTNFSLKDWIHHFSEVLHYKKINQVSDQDGNRWTIESVARSLDGIPIDKVYGSGIRSDEMCEAFTNSKTIVLGRIPDNITTLDILNRNYDVIEASDLSLDQLLTTNCLGILGTNFGEVTLNRFFKLWKTGECPRLERMRVDFEISHRWYPDLILEGLNYVRMSSRYYREWNGQRVTTHGNENEVYGGRDIERDDGTIATITMMWPRAVNFYVWSDDDYED